MSANKMRSLSFFFFNDPATTEIYTLSLHDALPIYQRVRIRCISELEEVVVVGEVAYTRSRDALSVTQRAGGDRKSTRLNSSHPSISYAVFCLKKKTKYRCPFARPASRSSAGHEPVS